MKLRDLVNQKKLLPIEVVYFFRQQWFSGLHSSAMYASSSYVESTAMRNEVGTKIESIWFQCCWKTAIVSVKLFSFMLCPCLWHNLFILLLKRRNRSPQVRLYDNNLNICQMEKINYDENDPWTQGFSPRKWRWGLRESLYKFSTRDGPQRTWADKNKLGNWEWMQLSKRNSNSTQIQITTLTRRCFTNIIFHCIATIICITLVISLRPNYHLIHNYHSSFQPSYHFTALQISFHCIKNNISFYRNYHLQYYCHFIASKLPIISVHHNSHFIASQRSFHSIATIISLHNNYYFRALQLSFDCVTNIISLHHKYPFIASQRSFHCITTIISLHHNSHFIASQLSIILLHHKDHFIPSQLPFYCVTSQRPFHSITTTILLHHITKTISFHHNYHFISCHHKFNFIPA